MRPTTGLKIGELSQQTGVAVGGLRYYETLGLITPSGRGENGYRYYTPDAVQQVQFIKKAQVLGFSLEEIRRILAVRDRGKQPCELVQALLAHKIEYLEAQIEQMQLFKIELEGYRQQWRNQVSSGNDEEVVICPLISMVPLSLKDPTILRPPTAKS